MKTEALLWEKNLADESYSRHSKNSLRPFRAYVNLLTFTQGVALCCFCCPFRAWILLLVIPFAFGALLTSVQRLNFSTCISPERALDPAQGNALRIM